MLSIAFGLFLDHLLIGLAGILFIVFGVVPFLANVINGQGFMHNVRGVLKGVMYALSFGISRRV